MRCRRCGEENPEAKKTCTGCGAFLEGYTLNNVTGEYGYRGADGNFYKSEDEYRAHCLELDTLKVRDYMQTHEPVIRKPIAYLRHEPTMSCFPVYQRIGIVRRLWLRLFFGLEYKEGL